MFKIEEINGKSSVSFCCFDDEFSGVKKIAQKVCLDVERVTGKKPCLEETDNISSEVLKSKVFFAIYPPFESKKSTLERCFN